MIVSVIVALFRIFFFHINKRKNGVKYLFTTDVMLSLPPLHYIRPVLSEGVQ